MKESSREISSPLNSLSSKEKFKAQNMENEGSLCYKLYKTFLNFLTTTCGTKLNHGTKAKEEGMGKELNLGYEDSSISLSFNHFLLCHELTFKELKIAKRRKIKELDDGFAQEMMAIIEEAMKIEPIEQDSSAHIEFLGKTGRTVDIGPFRLNYGWMSLKKIKSYSRQDPWEIYIKCWFH
ncbi:hypothetical protein M9H77_35994 [Catharanthus roseus]|uniref:Uncharacterized protein n=1 Tax=Catharanthus roseus TaxID=4058 RepID=A0ACB9ZRJ1_CATRO|nr:hypothetical protein M9H77_35994 [Catharanthus roseus]